MKTETMTKEHFPHDVCPKCGKPSVPAEKVPDQTLRGCADCGEVWTENLSRPATVNTKNQYTPGPWHRDVAGNIVQTTTAIRIAQCDHAGSLDVHNANARLIASAPEMFSLIEDISIWLMSPDLSPETLAEFSRRCEEIRTEATS